MLTSLSLVMVLLSIQIMPDTLLMKLCIIDIVSVFMQMDLYIYMLIPIIVLTKYYPKKTQVKQKNLLNRGDDEQEEEENQDQVVPEQHQDEEQTDMGGLLGNWTRRAPNVAYWHQNMTISIISDPKSPIAKNMMQPATMKCKQMQSTNPSLFTDIV